MSRPQQKVAGRRVRGRQGACEALPEGGVMALDRAVNDALKKRGEYAKTRWNKYRKKLKADS